MEERADNILEKLHDWWIHGRLEPSCGLPWLLWAKIVVVLTIVALSSIGLTNSVASDSQYCIDVTEKPPLWLSYVGSVLGCAWGVYCWIVLWGRNSVSQSGRWFRSEKFKNKVSELRTKMCRQIVSIYLYYSIIYTFISDCNKMHLNFKHDNTWYNYQCYAQILIYSSNLKTLLVNVYSLQLSMNMSAYMNYCNCGGIETVGDTVANETLWMMGFIF